MWMKRLIIKTHWNENVVILMKFSSLAALEVVILTTFSAASDENFIKMKTFPFQCSGWHENFYQLVRIEILATFLYIAYVYNEIFTLPNGIFTGLGRVDVDFFLPLQRGHVAGGYYWDWYPGTLSFLKVNATPLKIWQPEIHLIIPIFKWVAMIWHGWEGTGMLAPAMTTRLHDIF